MRLILVNRSIKTAASLKNGEMEIYIAGYVKSRDGKEITLVNARRLWKWAGAFTLSELAAKGSENEPECRFSCTVPEIILTEAIEIIPCTQFGKESIMRVKDYEC